MKNKPKVIWLYGLSGAGKTTIANALQPMMSAKNIFVKTLDGDHLRKGINNNLGFSNEDRLENIRRSAEVAKLFMDSGFFVIGSFITPTEKSRELAKQIVGQENFLSFFVKASIDTCRKRDPKGLYKLADQGKIANFTGVGSAFEIPENPQWVIDTEKLDVVEAAEFIVNALFKIKINI